MHVDWMALIALCNVNNIAGTTWAQCPRTVSVIWRGGQDADWVETQRPHRGSLNQVAVTSGSSCRAVLSGLFELRSIICGGAIYIYIYIHIFVALIDNLAGLLICVSFEGVCASPAFDSFFLECSEGLSRRFSVVKGCADFNSTARVAH